MTKILAAVFDIDGTLIDTSEFIIQAYQHVLQKNNLPQRSRDEISSQIGKKIEECYAFLAPGADYQTLISHHSDFQSVNIGLIKIFSHAKDMLKTLKQSGIKIGLWTGRRHYVIESLEKVGLKLEVFDCIIDATLVQQGKPAPDGLLNTLEQLGVGVNNAVMVGDSYLDIEAGRAAGVAATMGVTHGFGTRAELENAKADYILDSLQDLPGLISRLK